MHKYKLLKYFVANDISLFSAQQYSKVIKYIFTYMSLKCCPSLAVFVCVSSAQSCVCKERITEQKEKRDRERERERERDYANSKYWRKRKTHVSSFSFSLYIYIFSCQGLH